jgi:short-subunit dehydrogenase
LEIFKEVHNQNITIDILVNNAGCATYGTFNNVSWEKHMEMLQLNIFSLVSLTKLFLAEMTERKQGKMLNIASDAAYFPSPLMAVYSPEI